MKTYPIILALTALLLTLAGCTAEYPVDSRIDEGQPVRITIDTRGGEEEDSEISTLRVLGYRTSDGTLAFNEQVDLQSGNPILVKTGKYTVVLIANENSDTDDLQARLNGINISTNNTLNYLKGLSFTREAFDTGKEIPMVTIRENVIIRRRTGDDGDEPLWGGEVIDDGSTFTGNWSVKMKRLGVRVDLTLKLYLDQYQAWDTAGRNIYFDNVPAQAFIHPTEPDGRDDNIRGSVSELTGGPSPLDEEDRQTVSITRTAILPELYLSGANNIKENGLRIRLDMGNGRDDLVGTLASDPDNYAIPRNTHLHVTATASETQVDFTVEVSDWSDEPIDVNFKGKYKLGLSDKQIDFPKETAMKTITVNTDHPDGWTASVRNDAGQEISDPYQWLFIHDIDDHSLTLRILENNKGSYREGVWIYVTAGEITLKIKVTQAG
jgi:hypothetical protein